MDISNLKIHWYPGHMTKAKRDLQDRLKDIDVVVEVVDARAPRISRNPDFDDLFANKRRLVILNKYDLSNRVVTDKWMKYFKSQGIEAMTFSAIKTNTTNMILKEIDKVAAPIKAKYEAKGVNRGIRALVCGIPNVGKTAILNRLIGSKKLKEGNKPGVTRGISSVKITPYLECLDSPGLLWPKIEDKRDAAIIALIGSIKLEILDEEELAYYLIDLLKYSERDMLTARFKIKNLEAGTADIIDEICKNRGFILRGGVYDTERAYKVILDEFKNGKMGYISLEAPPEAEEIQAVEEETENE